MTFRKDNLCFELEAETIIISYGLLATQENLE